MTVENMDDALDLESMGITIEGLQIKEIKKIIEWYKSKTGDIDLEKIDSFCR